MKTAADFAVETRLPQSNCCECGYSMDAASGPCAPTPGDLTLCLECGSLNTFADDLTLRKPTDEEFFAAAADSDLQRMRRIILQIPRRQTEERSDTASPSRSGQPDTESLARGETSS